MDFFTQLIKQPPVTDRDYNDIGSVYSQEFSINKDKKPKGFNDDVSQIQVGSQHINQDSMNSIKRQHKLLSGRRQSDQRSKPYFNDSKQNSVVDYNFQIGNIQSPDNKKKDSKNSKLSLESKFTSNQKLTTQGFVNLHRQYSLGSRNVPFKMNLPSHQKSHSQIFVQIAQLKSMKQQLKQMIQQQAKKYKKLIQSTKIGMQIQIKKKINLILSASQRINQSSNTNNSSDLLKKIRQSEQYIKQLNQELSQRTRQNQSLQEQMFDLKQQIVGIDLQVEERFQKKRKQLQKKIFEELMKKQLVNFKQLNSGGNEQISSSNNVNSLNSQKHSQTLISNLIAQNKSLQSKCKSYETMLLQTDNYRKLKDQLTQKQQKLKNKQKQIEKYQQQVDRNLRQNAKKSLDLQNAQEHLNKRINSLKQSLKTKQDQLKIWEQELNLKAKLIDAKNDTNYSNSYNNNGQQKYNVTFQKLPQKKSTNSFKQYHEQQLYPPEKQSNVFSQQNKPYKIQGLNLDKLQNNYASRTKTQYLDTFRNLQNQKNNQTNDKRISTQNGRSTSPVYDPRMHEQYQRYDLKDKEYYHNIHQKYKEISTERISSPRNYDSLTSNFANRNSAASSQNKLSPFKAAQNNRKISPEFFKPSTNSINSFKYQSQYGKPLSVPLSHPNGLTNIKTAYKPNYNGNISPTNSNRNQGATGSYYKMSNHKANNKDNKNYGHYGVAQRQSLGGFTRSNYSKSSKDNSQNYGTYKDKINYQGYDMNKSKLRYEVGNLSSLGNKLQVLKSQLKNQIDSIL